VTKKRNTGPLMNVNIPAALLVFCYAFGPFIGTLFTAHISETPSELRFMVYVNVFFLAPLATIGTLVLVIIFDFFVCFSFHLLCREGKY